MGHVEVAHLTQLLPDGRMLLDDVSFRVQDASTVALVGPNGAGKSTLLRIIAGDLKATEGQITQSGGVGVMRQFIGSSGAVDPVTGKPTPTTVRDLLISLGDPRLAAAAAAVDRAELRLMESDDHDAQMDYAHALGEWGDAGGYDAEVFWDTCTTVALDLPFDSCGHRLLTTLSGGECKRLALEALLRGRDEVLLLDEPDNYLDVPGKEWLEAQLASTKKTVLFVSHDRELLARAATRVVTVEAGEVWTHGGGFSSYPQAREDRNAKLAQRLQAWEEEKERLRQLMITMREQAKISPDMAGRYHAMASRYEAFVAKGAPQAPPPAQNVTMRLKGGRTGVRAITVEAFELTGLMKPFSLEVFFGDRVAVLGANGTGKSHFLRALGGDETVKSTGVARLGARVVPGLFAQTHEHPELTGKILLDILHGYALDRGQAMGVLRRYGLSQQADQEFQNLSGGQQARLQVLLLERSGCTLLLLDEPTDNLDLASADALQTALEAFEGTVVAVTHDRWFARTCDRFLLFDTDGNVRETPEAVWDVKRGDVKARASR